MERTKELMPLPAMLITHYLCYPMPAYRTRNPWVNIPCPKYTHRQDDSAGHTDLKAEWVWW